jgi:hypothetical protein
MSDGRNPGSSGDFTCCAGNRWSAVADLGSAESVDFVLGRCEMCDRRWMSLWTSFAPQVRYVPVSDAAAERLLATPPGAARKRALADWFASR